MLSFQHFFCGVPFVFVDITYKIFTESLLRGSLIEFFPALLFSIFYMYHISVETEFLSLLHGSGIWIPLPICTFGLKYPFLPPRLPSSIGGHNASFMVAGEVMVRSFQKHDSCHNPYFCAPNALRSFTGDILANVSLNFFR